MGKTYGAVHLSNSKYAEYTIDQSESNIIIARFAITDTDSGLTWHIDGCASPIKKHDPSTWDGAILSIISSDRLDTERLRVIISNIGKDMLKRTSYRFLVDGVTTSIGEILPLKHNEVIVLESYPAPGKTIYFSAYQTLGFLGKPVLEICR